MRLCVRNVPWLQVSSMANVIISLSGWLFCTCSLELHTCWGHLQYQLIHTGCHQNWHSCMSQSFVDVENYLLLPHLCFCTGNHVSQWDASQGRSYMFFFLDSYAQCILLKYFHSNLNTISVFPNTCFSLWPPYHWKLCIHLNHAVYYIVDNFPVFSHPEFSHFSHLFHLRTLQHVCVLLPWMLLWLGVEFSKCFTRKEKVIHQYYFILYKLSDIL